LFGHTIPKRECAAQLSLQPAASPCERPYRLGVLSAGLTPALPSSRLQLVGWLYPSRGGGQASQVHVRFSERMPPSNPDRPDRISPLRSRRCRFPVTFTPSPSASRTLITGLN